MAEHTKTGSAAKLAHNSALKPDETDPEYMRSVREVVGEGGPAEHREGRKGRQGGVARMLRDQSALIDQLVAGQQDRHSLIGELQRTVDALRKELESGRKVG